MNDEKAIRAEMRLWALESGRTKERLSDRTKKLMKEVRRRAETTV
jgi:hypothetical protein